MSTVLGASFAFSLKDFQRRAIEMASDVFAPDGAPDPAARRFLEQMHEDAAGDDLEGLGVDDMVFLAADFWTWAQQRPSGGPMIRVHPGRHADGRPMRRDILEIVATDKPFLVDSVMAEINAQGAPVLAMFHPIVTLERDRRGVRAPGAAGAPRSESMMQVHLEPLDDAARTRLTEGLEAVLADVEQAVSDYPDMRARMDQAIDELKTAPIRISSEELEESIAFLRWLRDENFAFLGCRVYEFATDAQGRFVRDEPEIVEDSGRGVLRDPNRHVLRRGSEPLIITPEIEDFLKEPTPLIVAKANMVSRVHRRVHMDYVGVKRYRSDGSVRGETRFVGLFTAAAYHEPATEVPLVRRKVRRVMAHAEKTPDSHSAKQLRSILETYPRDELFQASEEEIFDISRGILHLYDRPRPKLFIRRDRFDRFLSALIYIPRERFNSDLRERVGRMIADAYQGRVSAFYPFFGEGPLARVHFIIGLKPFDHSEPDPVELERRMTAMARTWEDEFIRVAREEAPATLRPRLGAYEHAFSAGYRETFSPREALEDAAAVEAIDPLTGINVRASRAGGDQPEEIRLKVYRQGEAIPLSDVMPLLEAMGLHVAAESSHPIRVAPRAGEAAEPRAVWLHDFRMRSLDGPVDLDTVRSALEDGFIATWMGQNESDGFNRLILTVGADWRDVCFLRACAKYRQQTGLDPSQPVQEEAVADNPEIARLLLELKTVRFDPGFARELGPRKARQAEIDEKIGAALDKVASLDADRVLRRIWKLIQAIQRTSFYQTDPDGWPKPSIAIKIASAELEELPEPKPFREIFVWSPRVEGVHMRFGPVARGGLRWSDRRDDFRTEVLGLVKAQQVKNAVIVPVGAKGGFYPKQLPRPLSGGTGDREAYLAEGVAAYRLFVSSLLDVTDTIVDDQALHPHRVVVWDGEDPYLVVAADKGTATFSDIANEISEQRGFWLGDAFASGGSAGYDHKKMGITARGAWEAVKRHFRELGKNIQTEPFTVVGVGDMSGDVFGNGMLLSKQIKLLAAFDHRDIFIDPNPADLEKAWAERKRLFELPRSSWKDYDAKLISPGGGVFSRSLKSIPLTPEIKALTGVAKDSLTPADLIRALLSAEVELLWFGGIGAYVKAPTESDAQVGDKTNDALRVTADEVRAKVVGEGANLAVTQAGRIALARRGVKLNADFIDNSAGVDTSDHEVNIKILLNPVMRAGRLAREDRDKLLAGMTDDVAEKVLAHNYDQTLAISIAESTAAEDLDAYERMIERFEARKLFNRRTENLPTSDQFRELKTQGLGLTRPQIATLISWSKISLFQRILASSAPDDPHFDAALESYFPAALGPYKDDMKRHRLRREIVSTVLANAMVNFGGATFSHRARESTGADTDAVARGFEAARVIFGLSDLLARIHLLDNKAPAAVQLALYREVVFVIRRQTHWLVRRRRVAGADPLTPLAAAIEAYKPGVDQLRALAMDVISPFEWEETASRIEALVAQGAPEDLAREVVGLHPLTSATDVIDLAARTGRPLEAAARLYHAVGDRFRFDRMRAGAREVSSVEHWDRLAVRRLVEDLYVDQQSIAEAILKTGGAGGKDAGWAEEAIAAWERSRAAETGRAEEAVAEIEQGGWSLAKLMLGAAALRELAGAAS